MKNRQQEEFVPRGVYKHPFIGLGGESYLVAIDANGRRIAETACVAAHLEECTDRLWQLLDQLNPVQIPVQRATSGRPGLVVVQGGAR